MGEMLVNSQRGNIPVVIIRPTIVESTYKEPCLGWIQGNRCPLKLHKSQHIYNVFKFCGRKESREWNGSSGDGMWML